MTDEVNKELDEAKARTDKITANGYPPEMAKHYLPKIDSIQMKCNELHQRYVAVVSKPEQTDPASISTVTDETTSTDKLVMGLESLMKTFRKGTDVDIRRMASPPA